MPDRLSNEPGARAMPRLTPGWVAPETRSEGQLDVEVGGELLGEQQQQDQDDRRDVDAAEIGQQVPDRPQHRLGDAIEEFADLRDDRIAHIDHVEGHEPAQHGARNEDVDVELDDGVEEPEQGVHAGGFGPHRPARRPGVRDAGAAGNFRN